MGDAEETLRQDVAENGAGAGADGAASPAEEAPVATGDGGDGQRREQDARGGGRETGAGAHAPVAGAPEEALRGDVDELVAAAAQRDEYLALAQRTQADFENYRKRVARDAAAAHERGVVALARELLPALDNLDRALEAAAAEDPLLEGVRLVRSELAAGLARNGVESYAPLGEQFDPSLHEAVATVPQQDGGAASGIVVEVYQSGYRLGGNVIRPARVAVAA